MITLGYVNHILPQCFPLAHLLMWVRIDLSDGLAGWKPIVTLFVSLAWRQGC